tara:strand:- start:17 stop:154 length:138 start_codon:yes stop_codon:yes gene_type:complete
MHPHQTVKHCLYLEKILVSVAVAVVAAAVVAVVAVVATEIQLPTD